MLKPLPKGAMSLATVLKPPVGQQPQTHSITAAAATEKMDDTQGQTASQEPKVPPTSQPKPAPSKTNTLGGTTNPLRSVSSAIKNIIKKQSLTGHTKELLEDVLKFIKDTEVKESSMLRSNIRKDLEEIY